MVALFSRRGSNVRYINSLCEVSAGAKSNESIRRETSARSVSISRKSIDFSALAKSDSLKLAEAHCLLCRYSLH